MQPSVSLETTIVSYLTARPSRDMNLAAPELYPETDYAP